MKAAVFTSPGKPLVIKERDKPRITPDEMLVKVARCGICGTDIHASREGPFMAPPDTVFGHEFSGEIVAIGANLEGRDFALGDRVTSLPFIGDKTIGLGEISGAYSEFVKVGYDLVVKLPDALDDLNGALVEPLAVGLHSINMAVSHAHRQVAGKKILIIGAGPIGLSCAIWCRFFGAGHLIISEISPARRDLARKLGFTDFIDPTAVDTGQDAASRIADQFEAIAHGGPDIQFECVGAPGLLQQCIEQAPRRGLVMAIGVCDHPDTLSPLMALTKEVSIQWAVGYEKKDFEYTIAMMVAGRIDALSLVTDIVSLDELPAVFEQLRTPTNQGKVIIDLSA